MADMPIWEVVLYVDGPVTVRRRVITTQQKGFRVDDPFYSDIEITGLPSGLKGTVTARARPLDCVQGCCLLLRAHGRCSHVGHQPPDALTLTERERSQVPLHDVRRIIEQAEIESTSAKRTVWHERGLRSCVVSAGIAKA